jgi:prephenate dehydratase
VDAIWLPIENALEGSVNEAVDAIHQAHTPPTILGEWITPITHRLIQRDPSVTPTNITSHPQALSQCRDTLYQTFGKNITLHPTTSTSQAVSDLKHQDETWAALGTPTAATEHDLPIGESNLSDSAHNSTRFQLLTFQSETLKELSIATIDHARQSKKIKTPCVKTSVCIGLTERAGALVDVLLVFKAYNVTLTRIESRPARQKMGDYLFYIDVAADLNATEYEKVVMYLKADSRYIQISNTYPTYTLQA